MYSGPLISSPCTYASLGPDELDDREQRLKQTFGNKRVYLDRTALTNHLKGSISLLQTQFQTRCSITLNENHSDIFLTTKTAVKQAKEYIKTRQKKLLQNASEKKKTVAKRTRRHDALLATSAVKQETKSVCERFLEKDQDVVKVLYYEEWRLDFDQFWKSPKDDPLKNRFRHPATGVYVYVTDIHGLYRIEPSHLAEMPRIPTGKDMPCDHGDARNTCPFRYGISNKTKRKDKFVAEQKKSKKRSHHEWCDTCRCRVPNFRKHEKSKQHKKRVENTCWKDLDEKILEANKEWIEAKAQTEKYIQQEQERGKKLKVHPVVHMGDVSSLIRVLKGEIEPISGEEVERRKKRKVLEPGDKNTSVNPKKKKSRRLSASDPPPTEVISNKELLDAFNTSKTQDDSPRSAGDSSCLSNSGMDCDDASPESFDGVADEIEE